MPPQIPLRDQIAQVMRESVKAGRLGFDNIAAAVELTVQAAITEARREGWDEGHECCGIEGGEGECENPHAAGEHDTSAGEPAAERHEFLGARRMVGRRVVTGDRCASMLSAARFCGLPADHPVHQSATSGPTAEHEIAYAAGTLDDGTYGERAYCATCSSLARDYIEDCAIAAKLAAHNRGPATSSGDTAEHGIDTAAIRAAYFSKSSRGGMPDHVALALLDALDRQREETARLREQNLATDHDAFAALEAQRDDARALLRSQTDNVIATERLADGLAQQRDDALARLDEIGAAVPPCSDPGCGCTANRIRAILDREVQR